MPDKRSLTTGEAARYCHVSQATILNWIKKGKLKAYVTPGGHHRILLPEFLSFVETYGIPVDATLRASSQPLVLVVSDSQQAGQLVRAIRESPAFDVVLASNGHEAGAQMARLQPDAVVLDATSADLDWLALSRWMHDAPVKTSAILTIGSPEDEWKARTAGADAYLVSSIALTRLEATLETLLERDGTERG